MRNEWMAHHTGRARSSIGRAPQWHCGGQGFEPLRVHLSLLVLRHQPGWYRGVLFVPEMSGNLYEEDFLFISDGSAAHLGVSLM